MPPTRPAPRLAPAVALALFAVSWYGIPLDLWLLNPVVSHVRDLAVLTGLWLVLWSLIAPPRPRALSIVLALVVGLAGVVTGADAWARTHDLRLRYQLNQVAFAEIARLVDSDRFAFDSRVTAALPPHVAYLSVDGTVRGLGRGAVLVPLWFGIPDDAGGFIYSQASPRGLDMYGMTCREPQDLGDGWWTCGMRI